VETKTAFLLVMEPVYFVHISDTHFGPTKAYGRHGHTPYPCAKALVNVINHLPVTPDFVIHTGDVATDPDPQAYELAAEVFADLTVPIYYVVGNHDTAQDIRQHLPMGPKADLDSSERLSYTFEMKGYRFLVVDARGPDAIDPEGLLPDSQLEIVRREATAVGPPLTIFMHYPALPLNSTRFDENMLVQNGKTFHNALLPARDRLRGVFFGHIHQHMQMMRDGIVYASTASAFSQFAAWPNAIDPNTDPDHLPGYSFVHLLPEQTIIHHHTFPRP
jgi:Icc protein